MAKQRRILPTPSDPAMLLQKMNVPPDLEWDANNPPQVNACTGHSEIHQPNCDGNCEKMTMDEFDIKIENERRAWQRIGLDKSNYQADQLRQDVQLKTIMDVLIQRLGISPEEFNAVFKPNMLNLMQDIRDAVETQRESQLAKSRLIIPNGPIQ